MGRTASGVLSTFEPCWPGLALLNFAVLARPLVPHEDSPLEFRAEPSEEQCMFAADKVETLLGHSGRVYADFREVFEIDPTELRLFVCNACHHIMSSHFLC